MAKDWIIANTRRPYGKFTEAVMIAESTSTASLQADGLLVYTNESRYWIPSTNVVSGSGLYPFITRLSFTTHADTILQQIAQDGFIQEVTVYSSGRAVDHLKNACVVQIGASQTEESIIEQTLNNQ